MHSRDHDCAAQPYLIECRNGFLLHADMYRTPARSPAAAILVSASEDAGEQCWKALREKLREALSGSS